MNYSLRPETVEALRGKVVCVTGSAGFLGRHFKAVLHEAGCAQVYCMDPNDSGLDATKPEDWVSHDWHEAPTFDYIIHAAGIASPFHYRAKPLQALDAAVVGVRNAIDYAERNGSTLLFLSSSEIYGDPLVVPTPETYRSHVETMGDRACYDVSKCLGETLIHLAAERGVKANVVRIFNSFGPGMSDDDRRFMPNLRRAKRLGDQLKIYGTGRQTRTFCFVSDTIRGCLQALTYRAAFGRAWNIGAQGPELSMPQIASMAEVPFDLVPYPPEWPGDGEPNRRCPDISRARAELNFEPIVPFKEGLRVFLGT